MSVPHANPEGVVDVRPLGPALTATATRTLVKTEAVTVVRMVVPAGKEIPTHAAKGDLVVQCLEGKIAFTARGSAHHLEAGHLLHLPAGEPHSLRGIEDGSLLLTVVSPPRCHLPGRGSTRRGSFRDLQLRPLV